MKTIITLITITICAQITSVASDTFYMNANENARFQTQLTPDCHHPSTDDSKWPIMELAALTEKQHYCLRIKVNIIEPNIPTGTTLQIAMLASSDVYWDGEQIGQKGIPGTNFGEEVVGPIGRNIPMRTDQLALGEHLLSMKVSTYHHHEDLSVIYYGITLVDYPKLVQLTQQSRIPPILLIGALMLLFVLFQLIYWFYQKDLALLLFSLLCFTSGTLIALEIAKFYFPYPWDWHVIRLKVIIATTIITGSLLYFYYVFYYQLSKIRWATALFFSSIALSVFFSQSYDTKSLLIFFITLLSGICINIYAFMQGRKNALLNGLVLFFGLTSLIILPFSFIEKWFGVLFSLIAIANLLALVKRFGQDRKKALTSLKLESELLRRNLQPHFLMNSLTLIIEWIETQPKLAIEFIESLADEFRLLNTMSKNKLVTLKDELTLCEKHVAIMSYRYQKKIKLALDIEELQVMLPPAIIHTLIENFFSHNRLHSGDTFDIKATIVNQRIELSVTSPFRQTQHRGTGTGEEYIRSRLNESYSDNWHFASQVQADQWSSKLIFPLKMAGSEQ